MTSSNPELITLNADQEHGGLRAGVFAIVLVVFCIAYLFYYVILTGSLFEGSLLSSYWLSISCVLSLVTALIAAAVGETLMKRYWHSGRRVVLDQNGLQAWLPDNRQVGLDWSGRIWALRWHFSLKGYPRGGRERRLTKRHYCLACQLQQDDARVIIYGYLRGQQADELLASGDFHGIDPADFYERNPLRRLRNATDRPQLPTSVLTGKEGPFWLAEQRRWRDGIELTEDDFIVFYETIRERIEA